ncbi:hypothetical protein [Gorillibacterium timonense]|uniref:hypothetical protein n=1 Tax=Gorillibacterium timonense TaxID=1689269 RepID=UPI00071E5FE6|nr:hypothetical protein [Gorillibacterium timonense]
MPNYYAQIDSEGRVFGLSQLADAVAADDLIPIDQESYTNPNLLYTRYVNGEFQGFLVRMEADKALIAPDGSDAMTIQATVTDWRGNVQKDYREELVLELNGMRHAVKVKEGVADLTISSDEPGEFRVRTVGMDRNAELKVVVTYGS